MARSRIVEVDYHKFLAALDTAGEEGRIEPKDRQRWKAYVKEHAVKEASCRSYASHRSEKIEPVIISSGGRWDGYYVYSPIDEFCLKYEAGTSEEKAEAAPAATPEPAAEAEAQPEAEASEPPA